jgi:hypothetical protein
MQHPVTNQGDKDVLHRSNRTSTSSGDWRIDAVHFTNEFSEYGHERTDNRGGATASAAAVVQQLCMAAVAAGFGASASPETGQRDRGQLSKRSVIVTFS